MDSPQPGMDKIIAAMEKEFVDEESRDDFVKTPIAGAIVDTPMELTLHTDIEVVLDRPITGWASWKWIADDTLLAGPGGDEHSAGRSYWSHLMPSKVPVRYPHASTPPA